MNDRRLITQLKARRRDALDAVVDRYTPYVSVILYRMLGGIVPHEDIEEATADVFIALWRSTDALAGDNLAAYLGTIARNQAKNRLRALRPANQSLDDVIFPAAEDAESPTLRQSQHEQLSAALNRLGLPDSEIFRLYYFEEYTAEEIGTLLFLPAATVRTKLARGRRKLRKYFEERGIRYEELI